MPNIPNVSVNGQSNFISEMPTFSMDWVPFQIFQMSFREWIKCLKNGFWPLFCKYNWLKVRFASKCFIPLISSSRKDFIRDTCPSLVISIITSFVPLLIPIIIIKYKYLGPSFRIFPIALYRMNLLCLSLPISLGIYGETQWKHTGYLAY